MDTTTSLLSECDGLAANWDVAIPQMFYVGPHTTTKGMTPAVKPPAFPFWLETLSTAVVYKRYVARSRRYELAEKCLLGLFCWVSVLLTVVVSSAAF